MVVVVFHGGWVGAGPGALALAPHPPASQHATTPLLSSPTPTHLWRQRKLLLRQRRPEQLADNGGGQRLDAHQALAPPQRRGGVGHAVHVGVDALGVGQVLVGWVGGWVGARLGGERCALRGARQHGHPHQGPPTHALTHAPTHAAAHATAPLPPLPHLEHDLRPVQAGLPKPDLEQLQGAQLAVALVPAPRQQPVGQHGAAGGEGGGGGWMEMDGGVDDGRGGCGVWAHRAGMLGLLHSRSPPAAPLAAPAPQPPNPHPSPPPPAPHPQPTGTRR